YPSIIAADQIRQGAAQIGLGPGGAGPQGVGRITYQRKNTFVADPDQRRFVRSWTDQWIRIEFPVAGMEHCADRRTERDRIWLGDGVRQGDQFEVERTDREPAR